MISRQCLSVVCLTVVAISLTSASGQQQQPPKTVPPVLLAAIVCLLLFSFSATAQAQGGPPMFTDDPGTPGAKMWEVNFLSTMNRGRSRWDFNAPNLDLNYGLGNHLQLKFEVPWIIMKENAEGARVGLGNSMTGVKWRFLDEESAHINMSIYPQLEFNNPGHSVERGMVDKGVRLFLPVEVSKKVGPVEVDAELGYEVARHDADEWEYGFVVSREVSRRFELLGELHGSALRTMREGELLFNAGGRIKLNRTGSLLFSAGRTIRTPEGEHPRYFAAFGIQFNFRHGLFRSSNFKASHSNP